MNGAPTSTCHLSYEGGGMSGLSLSPPTCTLNINEQKGAIVGSAVPSEDTPSPQEVEGKACLFKHSFQVSAADCSP